MIHHDYNNIRNRKTSASSSFAASYTANALNQYSAIACTTPAKTLAPTYDADGNETCDGTWHYAWDGENRLTQAVNYTGSPVEGSKRLTFAYDYQSRRVRKTVETYASGAWTTTGDEKCLYNGWSMVCEYDARTLASGNPTLTATYTWGLDIAEQNDASRSGTAEPGSAAGGVGGLLAANRITTADATTAPVGTYAAIYDGNGNVTGLVNTSGASVAHYEYGPFGEVVSASGSAVGACPYGFSTKFTDTETGLCYYGYRYYNSEWGRWINRDPIGESGGINLYGFVTNASVIIYDILGKSIVLNPAVNKGLRNSVQDSMISETTGRTNSVISIYESVFSQSGNCIHRDDTVGAIDINYWYSSPESRSHEEKHVSDYNMVAKELIGNVSSVTYGKSSECLQGIITLYLDYAEARGEYLSATLDYQDYPVVLKASELTKKQNAKSRINTLEYKIELAIDRCTCYPKCEDAQ
jgi:RHS repeat-associated protein